MTKPKCLLCKKTAASRGLCNTHYSEWNRKRQELDEEFQAEFERMCIAAGKLLPSKHTGQRKTGPFDEIFEVIRGVPENMSPKEVAEYLAQKSKELSKNSSNKNSDSKKN